jgi:hypothetical protein
MTRSLLLATVARLTGESLATVQRIGFGLKRQARLDEPDADDPLAVIDCPCCGGTVVLAWNRTDELPEFADCRRCETVFPYSPHEVYETDLVDVPVLAPRSYASAA